MSISIWKWFFAAMLMTFSLYGWILVGLLHVSTCIDKEVLNTTETIRGESTSPPTGTPMVARQTVEKDNKAENVVMISSLELPPLNDSKVHIQQTIVEDFRTIAVEEEARRHDRILVESMAFFESLSAEMIEPWKRPLKPSSLSINIMTTNRKLRYIDALLMMLMKGQTPERLMSFAQVNVLNCEHRVDRIEYLHLQQTISNLPFLTIYNFSNHTDQTQDYIAALDRCILSTLPFCLILEDDALPPVGFIDHLEKFAINPLRAKKIRASSVSLYSYHSHSWSKTRLDRQEYIDSGKYAKERSFRTVKEYQDHGLKAYPTNFNIRVSGTHWGAVANLYTLDMAQRLKEFLETSKEDDPVEIDVLISREFARSVGRPRQQIEPSLVNHIGFYSERRNRVSFVNSDVRFRLDKVH